MYATDGEDRRTILLVEDQSIIALAERFDLERDGYRVVLARDGEEAVAMAGGAGAGIDLVLMDIDLGPGIDGVEAAERILRDRDLPVVFLSAHTEPELVERTWRVASYGYVVKQSGRVVLSTSIRMAFSLFAARERLRKIERELRASLTMLESAQDVAKIGFWDMDLASGELEWSSGLRGIFGLGPDEPTPAFEGFWSYVHPEDRAFVEERVAYQTKPFPEPYVAYVYRIVDGKGETKHLEHIGRQRLDAEGKLTGIFGAVQDVSERELAAAEARKLLAEKDLLIRELREAASRADVMRAEDGGPERGSSSI
jgi:PAS domain S-box-containing protein